MLLEALEILQSAGEDVNTYVTDFAIYKVINILSVYVPLFVATFLLSQEVLGQKIACFAPSNFTDGQAGALSEYCWNNGFWIKDDVSHVKSLFTQPHRYYAFYLAVQAVFSMSPIILWNVATKSRLLAVLRGTEDFMEDLVNLIMEGRDTMDHGDLATKVKNQLHQFHQICYSAASDFNLSAVLITRQLWELVLFSFLLCLQFVIYDYRADKQFACRVAELSSENIVCTVAVLDMLDFIWVLNVSSLTVAMIIMVLLVQGELRSHFGHYQPMFINDLPYGDQDDFNEHVVWDNNFMKHSYELLTLIYEENSTIMTQVYVLHALKPSMPDSDSDTDTDMSDAGDDQQNAKCDSDSSEEDSHSPLDCDREKMPRCNTSPTEFGENENKTTGDTKLKIGFNDEINKMEGDTKPEVGLSDEEYKLDKHTKSATGLSDERHIKEDDTNPLL